MEKKMFFGREVIEGKTFTKLPEMGDKKYYVECKFKGVQAERADMSHTEFNRCEFEGCNFKNAKMQEAVFSNSYFSDCELRSADLTLAKLDHGRIDGCRIDDMRLAGASFESIHMTQNHGKALDVDSVRFGIGGATQAEYERHTAKLKQELSGQKQVKCVKRVIGRHTGGRESERGR